MLKAHFYQYPITFSLIIINSLLYVALTFFSVNAIEIEIETLVLFGGLFAPYVVVYDEWWRLFTAIFLHGGITHLLMNMVSLYILGRSVEVHFYKVSYLLIYFCSGLLGAMVSLWVHPMGVGVGASGAIFGLFGAILGLFWVYRKRSGGQLKRLLQEFGVILGINLLIGVLIPEVDLSAHIAGFVVGLLGGVLMAKEGWGNMFFGLITGVAMIGGGFYLSSQEVMIPF